MTHVVVNEPPDSIWFMLTTVLNVVALEKTDHPFWPNPVEPIDILVKTMSEEPVGPVGPTGPVKPLFGPVGPI